MLYIYICQVNLFIKLHLFYVVYYFTSYIVTLIIGLNINDHD